jgi:2-succinyl-5-enolpyruvyl-6-hydroxy-3-cyclohexene-1-carboxylate synthase
VDQGDGQTIRQQNVFQSHIRYSVNLSEKYSLPTEKWYLERETSIAFNEGNGNWKGPIHFNVSLNEPLYNKVDYAASSPRLIRSVHGAFNFSSKDRELIQDSMLFERKLLIVGQMDHDPAFVKELITFANDSSVAVLVENTSNAVDVSFVHCIDRTLNRMKEEELEAYRPELLITVGGAVVSKRIKAFLRKNPPKQHWRVGHEFPYMDTYQSLSHTFITDSFSFFKNLNELDYPRSKSNYGSKWRQLDLLSKYKIEAFFRDAAYSDVSVFYALLDYLPEPSHLHMANSSVVRYCQLFDPIKGVRYWSNRGTSGIDGSTSTAVGASNASPNELHVLITGDVSFFYDSNGLWNKY